MGICLARERAGGTGRAGGRAAGRLTALVLLLALVLPVSLARGQARVAAIDHLALVVESSRAMDAPWLGTSRREALARALGVELRSLPLRVRARVWLVGPEGARPLPATGEPWRKGMKLSLPPAGGEGPPRWGEALAAARDWLAGAGGGGILALGSGGPAPGDAPPPATPPVFLHYLALGRRRPPAGWQELALATGGAGYAVAGKAALPRVLHRALATAISPARLLVLAADAGNRPLTVTFGLERRGQDAWRRRGVSGRPLQILPGLYRLGWPEDSGIGPGRPPARVRVARRGVTRLWAGGRGTLRVRVRDPKRRRPWRLRVTRTGDGRLVLPYTPAPFVRSLPSGHYLVSSLQPALSWPLELGAGREVVLVVGPPARLLVTVKAPGQGVRIAFDLVSSLDGRRHATGYTGTPLRLAPGDYRLEVRTIPPLTRSLRLEPGRELKLELPPLGALLVTGGSRVHPPALELSDARGRWLTTFSAGRAIPLRPGRYRLRLLPLGPWRELAVTAGRTAALTLSELR